MKQILFILFTLVLTVNLYSQKRYSDKLGRMVHDTTITNDMYNVEPIYSKLYVTSQALTMGSEVNLPKPDEVPIGTEVIITHEDGGTNNNTTVATDLDEFDLVNTEGDTVNFVILSTNNISQRYVLGRYASRNRWIASNTKSVVVTDESVTQLGLIGVDGNGRLSTINGEVQRVFEDQTISIDSIKNITAKSGTIFFTKGGNKYIVEDTSFIFSGAKGNLYGQNDSISRIVIQNGKYAHLQPQGGRIFASDFIQVFGENDGYQRAIDYVSHLDDAIYLVNNFERVTLTDEIIIGAGCVIEGLATNRRTWNQTPYKGQIILDLNDTTKIGIRFSKSSSGGYLTNSGIKNCIIAAESPAKAAVELWENGNSVFERVHIIGQTTGVDPERNLQYGVIAYGLLDFNFDNCYFSNIWEDAVWIAPHTFASTTVKFTNCNWIWCGNGVDSDDSSLTFYSPIWEYIDTSIIKATEGNIRIYDIYVERSPYREHTEGCIQGSVGDIESILIYGGSVGGYPAPPPASSKFLDIDNARSVSIYDANIGGYEYLIQTTDRTQNLNLIGNFDFLDGIKSPISGNYTGISEKTTVNILAGTASELDTLPSATNLMYPRLFSSDIERAVARNVYFDDEIYFRDSTHIKSYRANYILRSEEIVGAGNVDWVINPGRLSVTENDTLFFGKNTAEKFEMVGSSPFFRALLPTEIQPYGAGIVSIYYANSSFTTLNVVIGNGSTSENIGSITLDQNNGNWTRAVVPFVNTLGAPCTEITFGLVGSIGDTINVAGAMLEKRVRYDTNACEYIYTDTDISYSNPIFQGGATYTGNLSAPNIDILQTHTPILSDTTYQTGSITAQPGETIIVDVTSAPATVTFASGASNSAATDANNRIKIIAIGDPSVNNITLNLTSGYDQANVVIDNQDFTSGTWLYHSAIRDWIREDGNAAVSVSKNQTVYQSLTDFDFPSTMDGSTSTLFLNMSGVSENDEVTLGLPSGVEDGTIYQAFVSSGGDQVTVKMTNLSGATVDPPNRSIRVVVKSYTD